MKKFSLILLAITGLLLVTIVYERYFIQSEFGPSTMLAVFLLSIFFLALVVTYLSFGTRLQETITRVWLMLISIGISYLLVDLLAGAILIQSLSPELSSDEIRHHKLVPNTYSRFEQAEFSYIQRVNNLGIRGKDRPEQKPPGNFRILMLGDSFTMGKGVEDDETFSALLENSLNQKKQCKSGTIEVLNGGVDSYTPVLSYLQFSNDLIKLEPDVVILNLDVSDLLQEAAYRDIAVYDPDGQVTAVPGTERKVLVNVRIRRWIDQNMYFTRLLLFYTNKLFGYKDLTVQGVVTRANLELARYTLAEDETDRSQQWADIFESIGRIKKSTDENGISFVLVIYPWGHQVNESEWIPGRYSFISEQAVVSDNYHETIRRNSDLLGLNLVSLFPDFREYKGNKQLYFNIDPHWTTEGHKVFAAAIDKRLGNMYSSEWCAN